MTKTMQILAFLVEPRTHRDIVERFGLVTSLLDNLIVTGAARAFMGANERAGDKWQRVAVRHYVATGLPYDTSKLPKRVLSDAAREKRRLLSCEYMRKNRAAKKAAENALVNEIERLRDEAERLRTRIANDALRMARMADCASGEL